MTNNAAMPFIFLHLTYCEALIQTSATVHRYFCIHIAN